MAQDTVAIDASHRPASRQHLVATRRPFTVILAAIAAFSATVAIVLGILALSAGTSQTPFEVLLGVAGIMLVAFGFLAALAAPFYYLAFPHSFWSQDGRLFSAHLPREGVALADFQVRHVYQFILILPVGRYIELHYRNEKNRNSITGMNGWFYDRAALDRVIALVANAKLQREKLPPDRLLQRA